jgi:hypothetical protein
MLVAPRPSSLSLAMEINGVRSNRVEFVFLAHRLPLEKSGNFSQMELNLSAACELAARLDLAARISIDVFVLGLDTSENGYGIQSCSV